MPDLYPTFEAPQILEQEQAAQPSPFYGRSWAFDFDAGDFVLDGAGRVPATDGHRSWAVWCVKTILTERFAYLAYGPNYGTELADALRRPDRAAAQAEIERVITEALLADPRTEAVRGFTFSWDGDEVHVGFTVSPVIGAPERIEVSLRGS